MQEALGELRKALNRFRDDLDTVNLPDSVHRSGWDLVLAAEKVLRAEGQQ